MEVINNSSIMEHKTPKKRGRKTINIDYDRLEYLASLNMGTMDICRNLGISWDTFDRNKKRKAEFAEALQRGKAKGLQRATSRLMDKIDDGEFQAIQFYLKNADSDNWADRQEVNHQLNLSSVLQEAQGRIIEGERVKEVEIKDQFLIKDLPRNEKNKK
jgi:nucleotidyltransferase/DNA polymerase involved in DNA repair